MNLGFLSNLPAAAGHLLSGVQKAGSAAATEVTSGVTNAVSTATNTPVDVAQSFVEGLVPKLVTGIITGVVVRRLGLPDTFVAPLVTLTVLAVHEVLHHEAVKMAPKLA